MKTTVREWRAYSTQKHNFSRLKIGFIHSNCFKITPAYLEWVRYIPENPGNYGSMTKLGKIDSLAQNCRNAYWNFLMKINKFWSVCSCHNTIKSIDRLNLISMQYTLNRYNRSIYHTKFCCSNLVYAEKHLPQIPCLVVWTPNASPKSKK